MASLDIVNKGHSLKVNGAYTASSFTRAINSGSIQRKLDRICIFYYGQRVTGFPSPITTFHSHNTDSFESAARKNDVQPAPVFYGFILGRLINTSKNSRRDSLTLHFLAESIRVRFEHGARRRD